MNILLTCAGRRDYLVHYFRESLDGRGQVIACDSSQAAPALAAADRQFLVPAVDSPEYLEVLLAICREHHVRLLVPIHELELEALARQASRFRESGTIPVVAAPSVISTCQDKWASSLFLSTFEIATPNTFLTVADARRALAEGLIEFPLLVKPRWGVSSLGIETVRNERELELANEWVRIQLERSPLAKLSGADPRNNLVIQEHVSGQEYGLDVVNDLDGRYIGTLARRKLVMRYGNTDRAVTVDDPVFEQLGRKLGERLEHIGSLDCDVMLTDRGPLVLDLNPRFGGGYPFSHLAGANVPAALIAWANGEEPDPAWFQPRRGIMGSKYDGVTIIESETLINQGASLVQ